MSFSGFINYQRALLDCESAFNKVNLHDEEGYMVRFAIFSANLTNFLPEIPVSEHAEMFRKLLTSLAFETFDRNVLHISEVCSLNGDLKALETPGAPSIFCTFHLGSYRIIANLLIKNGHHFTTIVKKDVYKQQIDSMMDYTNRMKKTYKTDSEVHVVSAEDPNIVLKLLRELKAGRSLLVYLDGNVGTSDEKLEKITFLSRTITARKGMAYLSYVAGVPLVPVISYRKSDMSNVLYMGEGIFPNRSVPKEAYSQRVLQQLFDFFAKYVANFPEQWEGWNYIHHSLQTDETSLSPPPPSAYRRLSYQFNEHRYSIFDLKESPVLFDKRYYSTYEISDSLRDYLLESPFSNPKRVLGKPIFQELVRQEIII